ncbi:MAG TPA: diaminopimelate decarboxylase [Micropepsaceae bacterium]|nr:diaminopimelate decarboxylase [Micropepsaceae bacterium]
MNHFGYRAGRLYAEDCAIEDIAARAGTPFYCYAHATLERHFSVFKSAVPEGSLIAYAVKANGNLAVVSALGRMSAGADVVSLGELKRALAAGIPPQRIVFSGVGKTRVELEAALDAGIYEINVESAPELELLAEIAAEKKTRATIAIRVNPDVDALTHAKISTGKGENKFGVPMADVPALAARARELKALDLAGLAVHIGSQITDLSPLEDAFTRIRILAETLLAAGHAITRIDLGGGLGVPYVTGNQPPPDPAAYGAMVRRIFAGLDVQLIFEPGRLIVANAGILVARVIRVKRGATRNFVILDAAMNDLIRPALYDAHHDVVPVREPERNAPWAEADVVGPVCETGDTLASGRRLPPLSEGDLVAILSAGAYGAAQASEYNTRPLVPEVMVKGTDFAIVRDRPRYEDILARDHIPAFLR